MSALAGGASFPGVLDAKGLYCGGSGNVYRITKYRPIFLKIIRFIYIANNYFVLWNLVSPNLLTFSDFLATSVASRIFAGLVFLTVRLADHPY